MSDINRIGDNLVILSDNVPLDGRISWVAESASGFEPHNKYILIKRDRVLLIDTGVAAHERSFLSSLDQILGSKKLVVLLTRNELDCIGNLGSLLDRHPDADVVTTNSLPVVGLVHLKRVDRAAVQVRRCAPGSSLSELGFPNVRVVAPAVRLLGTGWIVDDESNSLFSSDFFGVEALARVDQKLMRDSLVEMPDVEFLRAGVLAKFEWLRFADIELVLVKWDKFFRAVQINALAPSHGRVYVGESVVWSAIQRYRQAVASASQAANCSTNDVGR